MITLPIKTLKTALDKVFSSAGYSFKDVGIKLPQPLNMVFGTVEENKISLKFIDKLPKISWKKFITISALIQEIILGDEGGIIRIKYFPDLYFQYAKTEAIFGSAPFNIEEVKAEIDAQYPDEERKKIASRCLHYANEWVIISYSAGINLQEIGVKKLKNDCYNFVRESVIKDCKENHGSFVVSFILIYVILPIILKWVIERIFARLSN